MDIRGENTGAAGDVDIGTQNNYFNGKPIVLPNTITPSQGFVGREKDLTNLRESYKNGKQCFVLYGTGGVGKSELARRFAEEIIDEYAAKILVNMEGMSEKPLSAVDAMFDIVVRQFEHEVAADISPAQLESLFVKLVQAQPTLIILDNAGSKESVKSLKDAKACLIITSRQRIYLNEEPFEILAMTDADAVSLLLDKDVKNRIGEYAGEIAKECGNLPLALNVIKALLMNQRFPRVPEFIADFKREKLAHLGEVEASFNLSYKNISEELQKRWRQLAVFPADFDAEAAAAVWEIDSRAAEKTLEALESYSLIEIFSATQAKDGEDNLRIRLHDLAREFANAKLSADERFQAQFGFAQHYASILIRAYNMQSDRLENYFSDALKLIDTEWNNITTGQRWAAEFIEKNDDTANLCINYSSYARVFIKLRLHPREDICWMETGLTAARKLNNRQEEGNRLCSLGLAYDSLGEYRKAIDYYDQALPLHRAINDRINEGADLGNLGIAYHSLGEYRKAIDYHEQSLAIKREIGNRTAEGISLGNLGIAYHGLGEYRKAIDYYEQYLAISRELGSRTGEGISLGNLGLAYYNLGEMEEACGLWKEAVTILEAIESPGANVFRQHIDKYCQS